MSKSTVCTALAIATISALALVPGVAEAATGGGGSMPYSSWLQTFRTSVSGEIAQIISLVVVVGGAGGLDPAVLTAAEHRLSLGPLTWPHLLVRGLLAEQLFRAQAIRAGHPYHRAWRR